jgi:hypothetical protein
MFLMSKLVRDLTSDAVHEIVSLSGLSMGAGAIMGLLDGTGPFIGLLIGLTVFGTASVAAIIHWTQTKH